jgi:hypothetical protein
MHQCKVNGVLIPTKELLYNNGMESCCLLESLARLEGTPSAFFCRIAATRALLLSSFRFTLLVQQTSE